MTVNGQVGEGQAGSPTRGYPTRGATDFPHVTSRVWGVLRVAPRCVCVRVRVPELCWAGRSTQR